MNSFVSPWVSNKLKSVGRLTHADAVVTIHRRCVRNDYLIALFEPTDYLDRTYRAAAKHYLSAQSFLSIRIQAKQANGLLPLPKCGAADIQNVLEALKFNCSINTQIRSGARRQRAGQGHINDEGAFARCGIYSLNLALNDSVACVHCH